MFFFKYAALSGYLQIKRNSPLLKNEQSYLDNSDSIRDTRRVQRPKYSAQIPGTGGATAQIQGMAATQEGRACIPTSLRFYFSDKP